MSKMNRTMLRAKLHRITVTECDVEYEGSLTLDRDLMDAADMLPFERIDVYDVSNGNRFSTYLIEGQRGKRECCVNGAAARLVEIGDRLILASFTEVTADDLADYKPTVVMIGEDNQIKQIKSHEEAGVRVSN